MEFIREGTSFFRDPQVRNPQWIERSPWNQEVLQIVRLSSDHWRCSFDMEKLTETIVQGKKVKS